MQADLHQLLSEGEQLLDFLVVFEQVGEGYLKQGQLVGEDLEVAAAAAVGEGLPEGHFKNTILSSAISLAIFSFSASASLLNAI